MKLLKYIWRTLTEWIGSIGCDLEEYTCKNHNWKILNVNTEDKYIRYECTQCYRRKIEDIT